MSDDKIAEIRDLYKYLDEYPNTDVSSGDLHHYLSFLLAEVERLRAEIEKLRADNERLRPAEMSPAEKMKILDDLRAQETRRRAALEGKP